MPKNDFLLDLINNINGTNGNFAIDTSNPDFKTSFTTVKNLSFVNNQTLANHFIRNGIFYGTDNNDLITIFVKETGGNVDAGHRPSTPEDDGELWRKRVSKRAKARWKPLR
jgi:hypothetical protein